MVEANDVGRKSIGFLIDELSVTNLRCWFAQEKIMSATTDAEKAVAGELAQKTNARRNQLMRAIDEYFHDPNAQFPKTYDHDPETNSLRQQFDELQSAFNRLHRAATRTVLEGEPPTSSMKAWGLYTAVNETIKFFKEQSE